MGLGVFRWHDAALLGFGDMWPMNGFGQSIIIGDIPITVGDIRLKIALACDFKPIGRDSLFLFNILLRLV